MEPVILINPEPSVTPAEYVSEPTAEPGFPQLSAKMPEQAVQPRRSSICMRAKPSWLIKTMLFKRLVDFDIMTLLSCFDQETFC